MADLVEFAVDRAAGQVEGLAEALVDAPELGAERDHAVGVGTDVELLLDPASRPRRRGAVGIVSGPGAEVL
ncbi:hypothetical protein GCM10009853_093520 [Glycomyces scopariae]